MIGVTFDSDVGNQTTIRLTPVSLAGLGNEPIVNRRRNLHPACGPHGERFTYNCTGFRSSSPSGWLLISVHHPNESANLRLSRDLTLVKSDEAAASFRLLHREAEFAGMRSSKPQDSFS